MLQVFDKEPWTGVQLEEGVEYTGTDRLIVMIGKIQGEDRRFIEISVKSKSSLKLLHQTLKFFNHPVKGSIYTCISRILIYIHFKKKKEKASGILIRHLFNTEPFDSIKKTLTKRRMYHKF